MVVTAPSTAQTGSAGAASAMVRGPDTAASPVVNPGADAEAVSSGVRGAGALHRPMPRAPIAPLSVQLGVLLDGVPTMTPLSGVDLASLRAEDEAKRASGDDLLRIGVGRSVTMTPVSGVWTTLPDGSRLYTADVALPGAIGVRLRFTGVDLGLDVSMTVSAPGAAEARAMYIDRGPFGDGEFWTPTVWADRARVEVFVPAWAAQAGMPEPRFTVDLASHIYSAPTLDLGPLQALPCTNDATCWPAWADVLQAVARYTFVTPSGVSVVCSGQLVNTVSGDLTPYFLSANHCVDRESEARSAEFYWFYQSPSCGAAPPAINQTPTSREATLIRADTSIDYSLMLILGSLPAGVRWVGWTGAEPADGTPTTIVHHPAGEPKAISFGLRSASSTCSINPSRGRVNLSNGVIELGSSGAGLYRSDTQQLFGTVFGACDAFGCSLPYAMYGRFSLAVPWIQQWLNAGTDDVFAGNSTCSASATLAPGAYQNLVVKSLAPDWYTVTIPPGRLATFSAQYNGSYGNIALALYTACGTQPVATAYVRPANQQIVSFTAPAGGEYRLCVYLLDNTRNTYSLSFGLTGACAGDANGDGVVNFLDLNAVLSNWGASGPPGGGVLGDVNGDGFVNFLDLNIVLSNYGRTC